MLKPVLLITALLGAGLTALTQESTPPSTSTSSQIPVSAIHQVNPIKPTTESIAAAKKTYGYDCAMCHGEKGDGKGETAADMKLPMKDLHDPATLKGMTDGEIYYIIVNGKGKMPPEGDRAKPDRVWNLVVYLRSFSDPSVLPK
ncbi:MAG TPA: cytochrome c [Acidisarcina sp.]|nr:cytochrome c [Acidisarcina sp.]